MSEIREVEKIHALAMERSMSKTSRLMVLSLTTVVIVICAVQAKAMPPRM